MVGCGCGGNLRVEMGGCGNVMRWKSGAGGRAEKKGGREEKWVGYADDIGEDIKGGTIGARGSFGGSGVVCFAEDMLEIKTRGGGTDGRCEGVRYVGVVREYWFSWRWCCAGRDNGWDQ